MAGLLDASGLRKPAMWCRLSARVNVLKIPRLRLQKAAVRPAPAVHRVGESPHASYCSTVFAAHDSSNVVGLRTPVKARA